MLPRASVKEHISLKPDAIFLRESTGRDLGTHSLPISQTRVAVCDMSPVTCILPFGKSTPWPLSSRSCNACVSMQGVSTGRMWECEELELLLFAYCDGCALPWPAEGLDRSDTMLRTLWRMFSSVVLLSRYESEGRFTTMRLRPHSSTVK